VIWSNSSSGKAPFSELAPIRQGLRLLSQGRDLAMASGSDVWEFAVEIGELYAIGVTNAVLRWLVKQGFAEHRLEVTTRRAETRRFHTAANLGLSPRSCFVVTEQGCRVETPAPAGGLPANGAGARDAHEARQTPHWDGDRRRLLFQGVVVKEFRGRPGNQELVLAVFQEEGWPPRVDDPLPRSGEVDPAARLRETVRRLNRAQRQPVLRFEADGRRGILWSFRDAR
jgi:hypothetical protein